MHYETIEFKRTGPVALVTLDRPDSGNRLDARAIAELKDVVQTIRDDEEVRVGVLTGSGPAFCAGSDLDMPNLVNGTAVLGDVQEIFDRHRVADDIASIECPTIAVINGDAIGPGVGAGPSLRFEAGCRIGLDWAWTRSRPDRSPGTVAPSVCSDR